MYVSLSNCFYIDRLNLKGTSSITVFEGSS